MGKTTDLLRKTVKNGRKIGFQQIDFRFWCNFKTSYCRYMNFSLKFILDFDIHHKILKIF